MAQYEKYEWQAGDLITSTLLNNIEDKLEEVYRGGMLETIANSYSSSQTYESGDYVIQNGKLYRIKNNNTSGTWNDSFGDEVNVTNLIAALHTELNSGFTSIDEVYDIIKNGIAREFSSASSYDAGDYVYYNNTLYRFNQAHASGNNFSTAETTNIVITDNFNNIIQDTLGDEYKSNKIYKKNDFVTIGNTLYKCLSDMTGAGQFSKFDSTTVGKELTNVLSVADEATSAAELAEAYAIGTIGGSPIASSNPLYEKSAKDYYEKITSAALDLEAYTKGTRSGEEISTEDPAYNNNTSYYLTQIQGLIEEIKSETTTGHLNVVNSIADAYQYANEYTYHEGDYLVYEGQLYKCKSQITVSSADLSEYSSYFEETNLGAEISAINNNIASQYSSSTSAHLSGEYVIYNNKMYKCKSNITSAEAFTSAKWAQTNVGEELQAIKNNFIITDQLLEFEDLGSGYVHGNNGNISSSHGTLHKTNFINVDGFKTITFPQYYSGSIAGYAFYTNNSADAYTSGGTLVGATNSVITVDVPPEASWFATSFNGSYSSSLYFKGVKTTTSQLNIRLRPIEKMMADFNSQIYSPEQNNFIGIFKHIGVIGDSLASGFFNAPANGNISSSTITDYSLSWIQQIAKRNGITAYNFSTGGLSSKSWLTSQYSTMLTDGSHDCEAYFIALCHNDKKLVNGEVSVPVGTSSDINDVTKNTFYRYYAQIISLIQNYAPYSKIFLITAKNDTSNGFMDYNTAIRYMPSVFTKNVYVLDMAVWGGGKDVPNWMKTGAHGNAMGYLLYSRWIEAATSWYIKNHPDEFAYVQLIGTVAKANIPDAQNASIPANS